jgi:hypothetical protein
MFESYGSGRGVRTRRTIRVGRERLSTQTTKGQYAFIEGCGTRPTRGSWLALLIAGVLLSSETPDTVDGGQRILDFYVDNDSEQTACAVRLAYGSLCLVLFAGALRSGLRRGHNDVEGPATLAFGGGLVMAVGPLILAGTTLALTQDSDALEPTAAG